jgi:hypothetical protein
MTMPVVTKNIEGTDVFTGEKIPVLMEDSPLSSDPESHFAVTVVASGEPLALEFVTSP